MRSAQALRHPKALFSEAYERGVFSGCIMLNYKVTIGALAIAALACSLSALPSLADSQARIVRLSDVQGGVQIDRNTGLGYEKAFLNLPVTQGVKIQTKVSGRAVVEFEDGGTLRVAPESVVEFTQLSLRDSGTKVSAVGMQEGTIYLNFASVSGNEFTLTFGHEKLTLTHPARLRVSIGDTDAKVAVFNGDVQVAAPSGTVEVSKNQTVTFDLADQDRSKLAKNVEPAAYDEWDKQQDQYEQRYTKAAYSSYSPYAYGTSDLSYYGSFFNVAGYGMLWQPYFVGAGWDPFMAGAWAYYPGFGYSWVSGYPWGWTPYHYGGWAYLPPYGWVWEPGGSWAGFNGIPVVSNPPANFQQPQAPGSPGQRIITVNRGPQAALMGGASSKLAIRNNSAGLGIPRGEVANLHELSQTVEKKGFATAHVYSAPIGVRSGWWRSEYGYGGSASRTDAAHGGSMASPTHMGTSPAPAGRASGGVHASPK